MIESTVIFAATEQDNFISTLKSLPIGLRPVAYSQAEDELRVNIDLDKIFRIENIRGFLWAPNCEYSVSLKPDGTFSIFISDAESEGIEQMMRDFSELVIEFGYACHSDERWHRNRIVQKKEYGTDESWVGRNYNKYLPGLYWVMIFPISLIDHLGIDIDAIRKIADDFELKKNGNIFARFYSDPDQWQSRSELIDNWLAQTPGCFSKAPVENEAAKIDDFMGMSDFLMNYN